MSGYDLPTSATIAGQEYEIRSDYRAVLDIMQVMVDPEISDAERAVITLDIFYPQSTSIPNDALQEAINYVYWFVGGGSSGGQRKRTRKSRLMDWIQDFPLMVAPINHVLGYEIRSVEYLHWWTFLSAYQEIGDCMFAQVVSIRKKRASGKKLDKHEREFYCDNRELIDLKVVETDAEKEILEAWM